MSPAGTAFPGHVYNPQGGGTIRRIFCALCILLSVIITAAAAYASDPQILFSQGKTAPLPVPAISLSSGPEKTAAQTSAQIYTDDEAGVTFSVPDGWSRTDFIGEVPDIAAKFVNAEGNIIFFRCRDIWAGLSDAEKRGFSRRDLDNRVFTEADIRDMFTDYGAAVASVENETVSGIDYFKITNIVIGSGIDYSASPVSLQYSGITGKPGILRLAGFSAAGDTPAAGETVISHVLFSNGIMYQFSYTGREAAGAYGDYLALLSSITFENLADYSADNAFNGIYGLPGSGTSGMSVLILLYCLVNLTALNALPAIIYRYGIRKAPVSSVKAAVIAAFLGMLVFGAAMALGSGAENLFLTGAVIIGGLINFAVLRGGRAAVRCFDADAHRQYGRRADPALYPCKGIFCNNCGAGLLPGSVFCDKCGTKNDSGGIQE